MHQCNVLNKHTFYGKIYSGFCANLPLTLATPVVVSYPVNSALSYQVTEHSPNGTNISYSSALLDQ